MASIYGTESSTGWQLRLDYSYTQNISANTSTITATLYVYAGTSPSYNQNTNGAYYTIQGTKTWNPYSYTSKGWKELGTKTWTENHNADGTLTLTLSGFWCSGITSSSYTPYSLSVNGGITLPTIPRASSIACGVCVIGSDAKITINRASTNFTHNLSYSWQGLSGTIATGVATNYTWAVPTTFYAKIPNAKSATGTITCDTYNGSTKIGTTTASFTASVDEATCKPKISPTAYDTNTATTKLTGDSSIFVKYYSNAYVSMGATAKNGASIKTYSISCGGKSISTAYGTIAAVESGTVVFTATDSRGLSTSQTLEKTLVNYIKLTCDLTATASTTDGNATLDISGNYFNSSFGTATNTLAVYYRYKTQNGEYSDWTSAGTASINGNKYTRKTSITGLDYTQTYIFQARAVDKLTDISSIELERTTTPIFDWGKDDFNINVDLKLKGKSIIEIVKAQICETAYPVGSIYMSVSATNPQDLFGGTWKQISGRILIGTGLNDANTTDYWGSYKAGTNNFLAGEMGGEAEHKLTVSEMPSHSHMYRLQGGSKTDSQTALLEWQSNVNYQEWYTSARGDGDAHNNMPPYLVVYMWKRTA